ncbi:MULTISPECIES: hypothetical protein [Halocynthiibacter]|uniref:Tyr recombinase domain-containing protein n=1 Tax=Halocynthiibacter halioticoli TaxID=2986804 RepID=A0AAE3J275_9RHOB|nr:MULTISPECIES: hypothetical protein [Halocynthiibacter]MCV6826084.1 hypothetical protein [Halocynthiibacter halioticoli]MCW4059085.1 hypothetical protein [Halocynthiibacter sp. SDUM655004]
MRRLSLRFEEWPEADRTMWAELTTKAGPLDPRGPLSHLEEPSRGNLVTSYGYWLGWLNANHPGAFVESPVERATPERVTAWMTCVSHLRPDTRLACLEKALRVLKAYAPDHDWTMQIRLASLLRHELHTSPSTRKRGRIIASDVLFQAGLSLVEDLNSGGTPASLKEAQQRRDGVMIMMLAVLPMRRRSFVALELGQTLTVSGDRISVVLETPDTKNHRVWETEVPASLASPLLSYIRDVRPWFLTRRDTQHMRLWSNDSGRPYCAIHLGARITRLTEKYVGARVCPHLFRDCAATTLAYDSPDAARLIRALLGHSTFRTAERHYNQARAINDGRTYASLLEDIRKGTK